MRKQWIFILLIYIYGPLELAQAATLRPFNCELRPGIKIEQLTRAQREWLLLLDVLPAAYQEEFKTPHESLEAQSFAEVMGPSLAQAAKLVRDCAEGIAFWQRFSLKAADYLEQLPKLLISNPEVLKGTVLERQLSRHGHYEHGSFTLEPEIARAGASKPWWQVNLKDTGGGFLTANSTHLHSGGVLGALSGYELMRQLRGQYPYYFVGADKQYPNSLIKQIGLIILTLFGPILLLLWILERKFLKQK